MKYLSTRGKVKGLSFEDAIMMGLAEDGGLLVPERIPEVYERDLRHLSELSYPQLAYEIMSRYIDDIPKSDLKTIIARSYAKQNEELEIPVVKAGYVNVAELFHGPTFAFKDVALQFLGNLFEYYLLKRDKVLNIVGATSGDTGSAAIYGMCGKKNINIFILYPEGRVSNVQELQMTTVPDENIHCLAVKGDFDHCQAIVKEMFSDLEFKNKYNLGAINSINWARILAQVVYYFYVYFKVAGHVGEEINFSVPTGNFGNILAGYIAKSMGLPIGKIVLANNKNNVLTRTIKFGNFTLERVKPSISPAMDIQIPSNFERYLYFLFDKDTTKVVEAMKTINTEKRFIMKGSLLAQIRRDFIAAYADDEVIKETMSEVYRLSEYVVDPHTACGMNAIYQLGLESYQTVCLATAHPAKFDDIVENAIGFSPAVPRAIAKLSGLPKRVVHKLPNTEDIKSYIVDTLSK